MPQTKRPRKMNDIVSVLDQVANYVNEQDYENIKMLLSVYDKIEAQITRQQKKFVSKVTLYTKTCHSIFEQLPGPLLAMCKVSTILDRVHEVMVSATTMSKEEEFSKVIHNMKTKSNNEYAQKKASIVQNCTQLQISIRIRSMSKILQINQGVTHTCPLIENMLPEFVLQSKYYMILKNCCLLGALVLYTERKKLEFLESLAQIRTIRHCENVHNHVDFEKTEKLIYKMIEIEGKAKFVKKQNTKAQKESLKKLDNVISILQTEYDSAQDKLHDVLKEIETKNKTSEILCD
jgi:hypothetical protein